MLTHTEQGPDPFFEKKKQEKEVIINSFCSVNWLMTKADCPVFVRPLAD
jgi:hypothetical protein